jgi:cobalamin biosynthesis Co2+ chelatase CbiK
MGLINILDKCPLRAKKRLDYSIFKEAVIYKSLHLYPSYGGKDVYAKMEEYRIKLSNIKHRAPLNDHNRL